MKVVIQRVKNASVTIDGKVFSEIGGGLLVLLGISPEDAESDADKLASKTAALRIFDDENGVMNRSVTDMDGDMLVVSQFTLMASWKKGNRPSYIGAARHEIAIPLCEYFWKKLGEATGKGVKAGVFGADMKVALVNDGPVTIIMDTKHPE